MFTKRETPCHRKPTAQQRQIAGITRCLDGDARKLKNRLSVTNEKAGKLSSDELRKEL